MVHGSSGLPCAALAPPPGDAHTLRCILSILPHGRRFLNLHVMKCPAVSDPPGVCCTSAYWSQPGHASAHSPRCRTMPSRQHRTPRLRSSGARTHRTAPCLPRAEGRAGDNARCTRHTGDHRTPPARTSTRTDASGRRRSSTSRTGRPGREPHRRRLHGRLGRGRWRCRERCTAVLGLGAPGAWGADARPLRLQRRTTPCVAASVPPRAAGPARRGAGEPAAGLLAPQAEDYLLRGVTLGLATRRCPTPTATRRPSTPSS